MQRVFAGKRGRFPAQFMRTLRAAPVAPRNADSEFPLDIGAQSAISSLGLIGIAFA
jgi:hypothetical protein